jgi:hypothetical protein
MIEKTPIDEHLYPINETNYKDPYQREHNNVGSIPGLTVDTTSIDPKAFIDNPGDFMLPNQSNVQLKNVAEQPGWLQTFGHALKETNELVNAGNFFANTRDEVTHWNDEVPDNWSAMEFESVNGFPHKYWPFLTSAVSPNDLIARQERVREQMHDDEFYSRGSFTAALLGGVAGAITSPSTYIFPTLGGIRYAGFSQNIIKNTVKAAPALSASIVANEGMREAARAGGNLEDLVLNSTRDLIFASALVGGGAVIGHSLNGGQLWNLRNFVNANYKGIDIVPRINKKGEAIGLDAVPNSNFSVSAAEVQEVQEYVNNEYMKSGLFKIPYLGKGAEKVLGNKLLGSNILRGLSSDFKTIAYFTDRMAAHGIITKGLASGKERALTAEENLGIIKAHTTIFNSSLRGLFFKMNGLEGGVNTKNAIKNFKQALTKNQEINWEEFGKQIRSTILTGESSDNAHINEGAKMVTEFIDSIAKPFREAMGWSEDFLSPRTSIGYYMQNYNIEQVVKRPGDFVTFVKSQLAEQDKLIGELEAPINEAKAHLNQLIAAQRDPNWIETRAFVNEINEARARLKNERNILVNQLRDNHKLQILAEERILLNSEEADELSAILKPVTDIDKEISKANVLLRKAKEDLSSKKEQLKSSLTDKTRQKNIDEIELLTKEVERLKKEIKKIADKKESVLSMLEQSAFEGKINPKFFKKIPDSFQIEFLNPNELPKLRKPFESDYHREQYAIAFGETLKGNSPEQLNQQMLGQMFPGRIETPQYLKKRSIMIPAEEFNQAGFLDNNLDRSLSSYALALGRHTAIRKAFNHYSQEPLFDRVIANLNKERKEKEATIAEIADEKKREKAYVKLDKKFTEAKQHVNDFYNTYMGFNDSNPTIRRVAQNIRNYTALIRLGGVPISQITDLGAIVLKQGLYPTLSQGLKPMLSSLNGILKTKDAAQMKENAAHGYVGIQHLAHGYSNKMLNADTMQDAPVIGKLSSGLQNLTHMSGNFYGTNAIENMNQVMTANIVQSKIMKAVFDYQKGKLTKQQELMLASVDINPKQWSDRFIKGYEDAKGWNEGAGYQSNYFNWSDNEATTKMAEAIYRETYNTIVQRGMFSSPFWTKDPVLGLFFTFNGWAWGALNRYTIPLMQRQDAQSFIGVGVMFGLGMLANPLRELANGKEVNLEDEHLFKNALLDSGFLGPTSNVLNWANIVMNHNLIPGLQNEKTRQLSKMGALMGPVGGVADDAFNILEHFWVGDYTQADVKKLARLIPFTSHLAFRKLINGTIDRSNIPEQRTDAEPRALWQALKGE